jgi:fermentation-respiration switch protein FrsA (DUF1100 family)
VPAAAALLPGASDVTLTTADGLELGAWHLPARRDQPTVLVANGNAGNRGHRAPLASALATEGLGVLLFDYRGYGANPGAPTEAGLALDARAARAWLLAHGVAEDRLVYLGESVGAAVAAELAAAHPPAGLVLRSPFASLTEVAGVHYPFLPVGLLLWDRFEVATHVAQVTVPTAVVYGSADRIVPPAQSRAVAAAAAGPVTLVEVDGADHNDLALLDGRALIDAVLAVSPSS